MLTNTKPIDLPNDVADALQDLQQLQPEHPLVAAYGDFIAEVPTLANAEHIFYRYRPRDYPEATFDEALVEFLAEIEDAISEVRELQDQDQQIDEMNNNCREEMSV